LDIEAVLNLQQDSGWKEKGWIPIAGDGCGSYNVISMLDRSPSGCPIFFIDERDYATAVYVVASNLWTFLRFVLRAEMLEPDEYLSYWPYNRERVLAEDPELEEIVGIAKPWEAAGYTGIS
jgi:hypothetical protein